MMDWSGKAALVTGGGSGIGKQLCITLAQKGCHVTVVDLHHATAASTAEEIRRQGGTAIEAQCNVTDAGAQEAAFELHLRTWARLDVAVLNAGIVEKGDFVDSDRGTWEATLDVNLKAVLVGVQLATRAMKPGDNGMILLMASAGGLFPMPTTPVYSASKAGLVQFTRSIGEGLAARGVRLAALCPQYVDTPFVAHYNRDGALPLLTPTRVVEASMLLLEDMRAFGKVVLVHINGRLYEWAPPPKGNLRELRPEAASNGGSAEASPSSAYRTGLAAWATSAIPTSRTKIQVQQLSTDFRAATAFVSEPLPSAHNVPPGHVLVRRAYAGINASDVNYTAGRYFGGSAAAEAKLPFDAGFESVGAVAAVGPGVTGLSVGDPVAELAYGAFAEWGVVRAKHALPVPVLAPEVVALLTSGLTASIGLEEAGRMRGGQTVLVTAAAGGTGQFVVQLAKVAGNAVVATCGSDDKAALLRRLGADRVVNYRRENLKDVLRAEYPKGIDLIWESVGGEMFTTCTRALAQGGRLVIIGMMSQYTNGWAASKVAPGLPELLLWRSATISGFFLLQYASLYRQHLQKLISAWQAGKLHVALDSHKFRGLEAVSAAQDRLHSGHSVGKIVVQLAADVPPSIAASARL